MTKEEREYAAALAEHKALYALPGTKASPAYVAAVDRLIEAARRKEEAAVAKKNK
jgi:hypothetical protein